MTRALLPWSYRHWRGRDILATVVAALALLAAAACGTVAPEPETVEPARTGAPAGPEPARAEKKTDDPAPASPPLPPLSMAAPVDKDEHLFLDAGAVPGPERLIGLGEEGVAELLGQPAFRRRDPPAQVWQYSDRTCILDVFLYREAKGAPYRVAHFAVRGRDVVSVSRRGCFLELLKKRRTGASG